MSDSIDESVSCMSSLKLWWSEDALREAYDASELNMVRLAALVAAHHVRTFSLKAAQQATPPPCTGTVVSG